MQLFGRELFNFKKPPKPIEPMYDFAQHGLVNAPEPIGLEAYVEFRPSLQKEIKKPEKERPAARPKDLYEARALHDQSFAIKIDPVYLQEQMELVREKLDLLGVKPKNKKRRITSDTELIQMTEWGAVSYGRQELESILERFQNRLKLETVQETVGKYPHTTRDLINKVVNDHSNLRCEDARPFVPDFPKDAIRAMKEYNQMCEKLCGKHSVFYVLAEKKADTVKQGRRDPILFAQSPFGFFWQILGAWDKEMVYLADL